jgi:DDE superfamily endonuclease
MIMLLEAFLEIVNEWRPAFRQNRTARRAIRQALLSLICHGRRTITQIIWLAGNHLKSWSIEYFLHSRSPWKPEQLFDPIAKRAISYCRGKLLGVVVDDTSIKKTGKKIKQAFWSRDPLSPPFWVNLRLGIRFLQFAVVIPLHKSSQREARTIPIHFEEVSAAKRPRKNRKDYQAKIKEYRELSKIHNLPRRAVAALKRIREMFDAAGAVKKVIVIIGDNAFCNKQMFSFAVDRLQLLLRCRKDIKLCKRSSSAKRFYDKKTFTPADVLNDVSIDWQKTRIFFGGKKRSLRFKEVAGIYWQSVAKKQPLRLFVMQGHHYRTRKTGKLHRRDPGFLLTTLTEGQTNSLLQLYFDRWQIEVNHREEKDTLHIGQAQLHNFTAVPKQPALVVAAYSALLLASLIAYGPTRCDVYLSLPRWRGNRKRPSCLDLLNLLRKQVVENEQLQHNMGIEVTYQSLATLAAA